LLFPALSLGWGGEGHQLVALIAENHLTPAAKAMVKDLLGDANISDAEVASCGRMRFDANDATPHLGTT
jgi:hypothetical protein